MRTCVWNTRILYRMRNNSSRTGVTRSLTYPHVYSSIIIIYVCVCVCTQNDDDETLEWDFENLFYYTRLLLFFSLLVYIYIKKKNHEANNTSSTRITTTYKCIFTHSVVMSSQAFKVRFFFCIFLNYTALLLNFSTISSRILNLCDYSLKIKKQFVYVKLDTFVRNTIAVTHTDGFGISCHDNST